MVFVLNDTYLHFSKFVPSGYDYPNYDTSYSDINTVLSQINKVVESFAWTNAQATQEDAFDWHDAFYEGGEIWACNKNLTAFPTTAQKYIETSLFMDLSANKLVSLPITSSWKHFREIDLVKNNFSLEERQKIKQLLSNTKIIFTPQNDFNPSITADWKQYTNSQNHFSFRYHPDPELAVKEEKGDVLISNELGSFNTDGLKPITYHYNESNDYINICRLTDSYIGISISVKDNPDELQPLAFMKKELNIPALTENGDVGHMISPLKPYKNGAIDGIMYNAGENENYNVLMAHNKKMYIFRVGSNGQTGTTVGEIAKKLYDNILTTVRFND